MQHGWKYGLIKLGYQGRGIEVLREPPEGDEETMICMLVELFPNDAGEYTAYGSADLNSLWALEAAYKDVQRDGINTWFFDHGAFEFRAETEEEKNGHGYQFFWKPFDRDAYKKVDPFSALIERIDSGEEKLLSFEEVMATLEEALIGRTDLEAHDESGGQSKDGTGASTHPVASGEDEDP